MTRPRTIAIGDIHGCAAALSALLEVIEPTEWDKIVALGDYVDRGPDSRGVIERLITLRDECNLVPLIGNHEVMMLDALDEGGDPMRWWRECGGEETLASYDGSPKNVPEEHLDFLRALIPFYEGDNHLFVHANYDHGYDLNVQPQSVTLWRHLDHGAPAPHHSGKTVFVGHTPQRTGEILDLDHVVCIDTACVMGGWLTALDVDTREVWQVDAEGNLRE